MSFGVTLCSPWANSIPVPSCTLHNPSLCTMLSDCWGGGNVQHSFPGAPVPRDLAWNSGACVSWHSMARLQSCTEVVSCTALSDLCSAYSGVRRKPSLRLCRPPLVVARGEGRAQPPAEYRSLSPLHFPEGAKQPSSCNPIQVQLVS